MSNKLNYIGITSSIWMNLQSTEIADGVHEYILWKGENGKQAAIYEFQENTEFNGIDAHEYGEEHIFVISGIFSDGKIDYQEGSYIVNPRGTAHIPQSKVGCVVLVTFPNGRQF